MRGNYTGVICRRVAPCTNTEINVSTCEHLGITISEAPTLGALSSSPLVVFHLAVENIANGLLLSPVSALPPTAAGCWC